MPIHSLRVPGSLGRGSTSHERAVIQRTSSSKEPLVPEITTNALDLAEATGLLSFSCHQVRSRGKVSLKRGRPVSLSLRTSKRSRQQRACQERRRRAETSSKSPSQYISRKPQDPSQPRLRNKIESTSLRWPSGRPSSYRGCARTRSLKTATVTTRSSLSGGTRRRGQEKLT